MASSDRGTDIIHIFVCKKFSALNFEKTHPTWLVYTAPHNKSKKNIFYMFGE